jgi:hypothetical protein
VMVRMGIKWPYTGVQHIRTKGLGCTAMIAKQ